MSYMEEATPQGDSGKDIFAYLGLGAGVFSLCAWIIPLCGCPISLIALGLGFMGLSSNQRTLAMVGMVLGGLGFVLTIISAIIGVAVNVSG